jgi:hypothetical protein
VRGIAQPTHVGGKLQLGFRLEPQTAAEFAPQSVEGRTFIFAVPSSEAPGSISFTNSFKTESGLHYVAARSGYSFRVHHIRSSGVFPSMNLQYGFDGGGSLGPISWYNAGDGWAMGPSIDFIDTAGSIAPPDTLRDHRVDIVFLADFWGPNGPWQNSGKLELSGLNEGRFTATNYWGGAASGDYNYSVRSNIATISLATDPLKTRASYTMVFTSPTSGRFVYVDATRERGYVGVFRNFFSLATSILLTANITYDWRVPYSERLELTLGDESTGFRFFTPQGYRGTYEIVGGDSAKTLKLFYSYPTGEATNEIDILELEFVTPASGSITGQMHTWENGEAKIYPITGSFQNFAAPQ